MNYSLDKADIEEYHGNREIEEIHGILFLEKKSANIKEFIDILKNLDNYDEFLKLNDYYD